MTNILPLASCASILNSPESAASSAKWHLDSKLRDNAGFAIPIWKLKLWYSNMTRWAGRLLCLHETDCTILCRLLLLLQKRNYTPQLFLLPNHHWTACADLCCFISSFLFVLSCTLVWLIYFIFIVLYKFFPLSWCMCSMPIAIVSPLKILASKMLMKPGKKIHVFLWCHLLQAELYCSLEQRKQARILCRKDTIHVQYLDTPRPGTGQHTALLQLLLQ